MHPAIIQWWNAQRGSEGGGCEAWSGQGPSRAHWRGRWRSDEQQASGDGWEGEGGGGFGVRRPLRFLAYKLGLDERQVGELAKILNELKVERAQGEVDHRRTLSAFADAVGTETFDEKRAGDAGQLRVDSAQRLRDAVLTALKKIHALLDPDQREKLAYLIRTGTLQV
jgi:Spy/CpxP family protein refolding chaperone